MHILIIDNTSAQLAAAKTQLEALGHTVTCVDSFDAFTRLVMPTTRFLRFHEPKLTFDVVLTDLFMPSSAAGLSERGREAYFRRTWWDEEKGAMSGSPLPGAPEVAYGMVIAMVAALAGAKKVGVLSIGDHHDDPLAWAMDAIEHAPLFPDDVGSEQRFPRTEEEERKAGEGKKRFVRTFVVNGATTAFFTGYACPRIYTRPEGRLEIVKNWAAALERLMSL